MFRRRAHRLATAFFVVLSLLFAQLALANYICPEQQDPAVMLEMMAAGAPCDGMDQAQPALCHEFSVAAPQSAEVPNLPAPALPAVLHVLQAPFLPGLADADRLLPRTDAGSRPPPDPLFLSTLRLRV